MLTGDQAIDMAMTTAITSRGSPRLTRPAAWASAMARSLWSSWRSCSATRCPSGHRSRRAQAARRMRSGRARYSS
ncbi:hypothetical protein A9R04_08915 [Nocardiopsis dassonvillei]|nr:hypothetical protein A9R04_08915 [Nocardiopsis dassonvillei]